MENNPTIEQHLVEAGAYSDKETPVLITSGESLTPFFINTEKLTRHPDISGVLKKHKDNPGGMVAELAAWAKQTPEYREDIELIAERVQETIDLYTAGNGRGSEIAISGGQRRDWPFSGLVADYLSVPHLALFKQEGGSTKKEDKSVLIYPEGGVEPQPNMDSFYVVHLGDLMTKGSSTYRADHTGRELGWVPMVRNLGGEIGHAYSVVTRRQGGEEMLSEQGIQSHSLVTINEDFLRKHSNQPETVMAYLDDEKAWTETYLLEHGVDVLVPNFDEGTKLVERARKFMGFYGDFLQQKGLITDLNKAVSEAYGKNLVEIAGGKNG